MKNITVLRGGAIGDFVLSLPAITALQRAFPATTLRLVGNPKTLLLGPEAAILDHDSPLLTPLHGEGPLPAETRALFASTQRILAYAVDSKGNLERQLNQVVEGPVLLWDPRPPGDARVHIVDHLLSPLRQWGISSPDPVPRIELLPDDYRYVDALAARLQVILHPGSGSVRKCWPLTHFQMLAGALRERGWCVEVLLGPVERERDLGNDLDSVQPPDLRSLAGLLDRASLFIGNDSGPGHIAAAVGTPTLSLFGPTDPHIWAPKISRGRVLQTAGGHMATLSVDSVLQAALQILEAGGDD